MVLFSVVFSLEAIPSAILLRLASPLAHFYLSALSNCPRPFPRFTRY